MRYHYTMDHPFPHTYDVLTNLKNRNTQYFEYRNPKVLPKEFNRTMQIHAADGPGYGEFDPFSVYEHNGTMGCAEYYIETHIDQFYRILFFFMELQMHGISSDAEDIYNGTLPHDVMRNGLQAIVYDDRVYRKYLLSLGDLLEMTMTNNPRFHIDVGQRFSSARIREEDLISLLSIWIQYKGYGEINNNRTMTIRPFSTTTPKSDDMRRKGSVLMNSRGKHFCKLPKTTSSDDTYESE